MTNKNNAHGSAILDPMIGAPGDQTPITTSLRFAGSEITLGQKSIRITRDQYAAWKRHYLFDAVRGMRFGQSFCTAWDLRDLLLWFEVSDAWCERWILSKYVR